MVGTRKKLKLTPDFEPTYTESFETALSVRVT
jgi:hypothetical protein